LFVFSLLSLIDLEIKAEAGIEEDIQSQDQGLDQNTDQENTNTKKDLILIDIK